MIKTKIIQSDFSIQISLNNNKFEKKFIHGTLTVKLPDKIKIDLDQPISTSIFINEKNIAILNKQNSTQYTLQSDYELLLKIFEKINNNKIEEVRDFFNFRLIGNHKGYKIIEMIPATLESNVNKIVVTTSDQCPGIVRLILIDHELNIFKIDFNSFKVLKQLPPNFFKANLNKSFKTILF
ncbi:MAG: outer-membrane lipoprotein carrier protein LolA [Deltaproteobacteria bacterium]|nr:outer-membrane lipoprotein carrier protein LolA [Deltaproteobacteria bacterium]